MQDHQTGGCLCGKVRFTTTGPLREVIFCHCSQCRRQSGLYFAATSVRADCLALEGAGKITLRHGPIKKLGMDEGMTMVFKAQSPEMLKQVKAGDKVRFDAEKVNGQMTVTGMAKAK